MPNAKVENASVHKGVSIGKLIMCGLALFLIVGRGWGLYQHPLPGDVYQHPLPGDSVPNFR